MKERIFIAAGLLFLLVTTFSNAEMRTTPDSVTSPNDSAVIHVTANVSTDDFSAASDASIVKGINTYSGGDWAYGGFFQSASGSGKAVYGWASNTGNVYNYGGYFEAAGDKGTAVHGYAYSTESGTSYGGYFTAAGESGTG